MFYNLSEEQINTIKNKFYPQESFAGEFLRNVIVNDAGPDNPDNILQVAYSFRDGANSVFKVFKNETSKKYMKIKVFEILNSEMRNAVTNFKNIEDLENIINFFGAISHDLNASYDFVGDKNNIVTHLRFTDGSIELLYNITFNLSRPKINFFSLGVIFYFDKQQFLNDQKIEEQFLNEKVLFNKLLIYNLYENNEIVQNPVPPVQDLRLIKLTFKETGFLDNLLQVIDSDKGYQNLTAANRSAAIDKLSPTNISPTSTIAEAISILPFRNKKIIRAKPIKKPNSVRKAFSSAFYSRNSNLFLGLAFTMDYEFIVINNTPYPTILASSDLKEELFKKCKISSINILRRAVENKTKNKDIHKPDTTVVIVGSGESTNSNTVSTVEDKNGSIAEISLNTNSKTKMRSFAVTDKKVFIDTADTYQYGVEVNINDGITKFLNDRADALLKHVSELNEYLEETNKIVTVVKKQGVNVLRGSYDPQKNSFTKEFIENFNKPRGDAKSFAQMTIDAAVAFEATLNLMGNFSSQMSSRAILQQGLTNTIISMLDPASTSAESISYFIKIYQRLISQIKRIVKNNFNNSYKVTYWFTNDYVDSKTPINIGYRFIDIPQYSGLGVLNTDQLNERVISEVNRYTGNLLITPTNLQSKQYSYISPSVIFSKNKILNLADLNANPSAISALDFAEMEIDIKNGNLSLTSIDKEKIINNITDKFKNKAVAAAINSTRLAKPISLNIKNVFKPIKDLEPIKQNLPLEKNDNTNETQLMLALAKQFDLTTGKYKPAVNNNTKNITRLEIFNNSRIRENILEKAKLNTVQETKSTALSKKIPSLADLSQASVSTAQNRLPALTNFPLINTTAIQNRLPSLASLPIGNIRLPPLTALPQITTEDLPVHVNLLLDDKCVLLKASDNYKKSLELNSKYQFLFNTLHSIEILEYANGVLDEQWSVITREKIENLQKDNLYLFRIKNYRNSAVGIEGMEQIKLPVYDQYFLFRKTDATRRFQFVKIKDLNEIIRIKKDLFIEKLNKNVVNKLTALNKLPSVPTRAIQPIKTVFSPKTTNIKKGGR